MPNLVFHTENHTYTLDGIRLPGVTEIIGRRYPYICHHGSTSDACEQCKYLRDLGHAVHAATAYSDRGTLEESTVDPAVLPRLNQWQRLIADFKPEVFAIEKIVHYKNFYMGTLDRVLVVEKRVILVDIKSGAKMKHHSLQTSAYAGAWNEMNQKKKINERWAVYLDGSDMPAKIEIHNKPGDFPAFLNLLSFTNWEMSQ